MPNFGKTADKLRSVEPLHQRDLPSKSFGQRDDHPHPESQCADKPSRAEQMAGVRNLKE